MGMNWCEDFDAHSAARAHEFCEVHQLAWCRLCDHRCVECRYQDSVLDAYDDACEDDADDEGLP